MNFAAIFGGSLWSGYALPACHPRKWPPTATGRDSTIQSGNLSRRSRPPLFCFVAADSVYGTGEIETTLRKAGKGYVLGVAANRVFHSWGKKQFVRGSAAKIAQTLAKSAWRRLSAGEGTKGPRLHDWAYVALVNT